MRIFAFHLLNDFSGSPKVLSQLLKGWKKEGFDVNMVTSDGREGFLSDIEGVNYIYYPYKFSENKWIRLVYFMFSQFVLFVKLFSKIKKTDIVYVNTVLPFGAAVLGKLKGCRVVYHIHETTMKPKILKVFLFGIVRFFATDVIYVSHFLSIQQPIKGVRFKVIHNALEQSFIDEAIKNPRSRNCLSNLLMVCSLKEYKGVNEFVELSRLNLNQSFMLIVNATKEEISDYFKGNKLTSNLTILPVQTNLHPHYQWADLILNLSKPDGWVETFGLTILEGMAYGLPAIVPPIGGVVELVDQGRNGFLIDSRNIDFLDKQIKELINDNNLYQSLIKNSFQKLKEFDEGNFINRNINLLTQN